MTKKMPNLFAKNPPKSQFETLDALVDDWIYRFGSDGISKHMRDEVVDYTVAANTWFDAVQRACDSRRPNGKMHNHQSRVPQKCKDAFKDVIYSKKQEIPSCKSFDTLHDMLEIIAPEGIGPVTVYDVATRLAAYLGIEPQSLYLHAGVHEGWARLHGKRMPIIKRIPKDQLPKPLQRIPCDQVEDMLCAYRDYLKPHLLQS